MTMGWPRWRRRYCSIGGESRAARIRSKDDGGGGEGEDGVERVALRMVDMPARSSEEGRRRRLRWVFC